METNIFHEGDNIEVMADLPDASIDLIYADPPFNTGRDFGEFTDKIASDVKERYERVVLSKQYAWLGATATPNQFTYFKQVIPVIEQCHRVLKRSGAIYWHCDYKTSAQMRLILNQIFQQPQFRNEIAWRYHIRMLYDTIKNRWKNNYDTILFYAKADHVFESQFHDLTYRQLKSQYPYRDSAGRKYRVDSLRGTRHYADENKGTRIGTVWTDIRATCRRERTGYPTQKPLALLKRIICASSHEGEIVLDPFCGSGTTCVAAKQLNRQYIGIDRNPEAIHIATERIK